MSSKTKAKTAVKATTKSPAKAEQAKAAVTKTAPKALVRNRPAPEPVARTVDPKKPAPAETKTAPAETRSAAAESKPAKANGHAKTTNGAASATPTPGSVPRSANGITVRPPSGTVVRPSRPPTPRATRVTADVQPAIKGPFHGEDLLKWRQLLLAKRSEISNDIVSLEQDAMEAEDGHTTPQHTAERGSDADLQDVALNLAGQEKELLWQIDRALRKIESSDPFPYGLCEYTKQPIARGRLEQMPWTPLSIEGATHLERNGLTLEDLLVEG